MDHQQILNLIRIVPDYPKAGIEFYDITTVLKDPRGLRAVIDGIIELVGPIKVDKVIGTEARGFIFAPAIAYELRAGFVPVRKPNKLPSKTIRFDYDLEYGSDSLEMHDDAILPNETVLIIDDLLATGGTAKACTQMVEQVGAKVAGLCFLLELEGLGGRELLQDYPCHSLLKVKG